MALRGCLQVLNAITDSELDAAFATLNQQPVDAMVVATNPFFIARAKQIAAFAASHSLPVIYGRREFAEAGGLMSYGADIAGIAKSASMPAAFSRATSRPTCRCSSRPSSSWSSTGRPPRHSASKSPIS
jgi:putative tryptophan/tyrosine transport system substrate-binding protein